MNVFLLVLGIAIGYWANEILRTLKRIEKLLLHRKQQEEPPKSRIIEPPESAAERVVREQSELIERLNGGA